MLEVHNDLRNWPGARLPEAVVLNGHWVQLEPLSAARHAAPLWTALQGHDHAWDWMADGPYPTEEALTESIAAKETGAAAQFFAILPHDAAGQATQAVGYASLMRMDAANGVVEVGNVMFSPALQRTAAATEAMYLMARHVFEDLGYRRYEWKCNALNLPSKKAAERFGFLYEGIFRQHMVIKGRNRDTAWYSMLDSEWPLRRQAFETWLTPENFDERGRQVRSLSDIAARLSR